MKKLLFLDFHPIHEARQYMLSNSYHQAKIMYDFLAEEEI
jgi:hypothetical protein